MHWANQKSDQNATTLGVGFDGYLFIIFRYLCIFLDMDGWDDTANARLATKRHKYLSKNSHGQTCHEEDIKVGQQVPLDRQDGGEKLPVFLNQHFGI